MCGRYYRTGDKQAIAEAFRADLPEAAPALGAEYNIAPTTTQPVLRQGRDTGRRELAALRWGLVGFGSRGPDPRLSTFNARAETLARSSLWRTPLHKRRCLVPVSGYYEWKQIVGVPDPAAITTSADTAVPLVTKEGRQTRRAPAARTPFRFSLANTEFFALAGLWDAWQSPAGDWLQSFSIITVPSNAVMAPYHDRMPAILPPARYDEWLDRGEVERPPVHLLAPYAGTDLVIHQAHPKVGNIRNQGPELLNSL